MLQAAPRVSVGQNGGFRLGKQGWVCFTICVHAVGLVRSKGLLDFMFRQLNRPPWFFSAPAREWEILVPVTGARLAAHSPTGRIYAFRYLPLGRALRLGSSYVFSCCTPRTLAMLYRRSRASQKIHNDRGFALLIFCARGDLAVRRRDTQCCPWRAIFQDGRLGSLARARLEPQARGS